MLIELECVSCGKPLAVPDTAAGRKARCPHCRTTFAVPNGELNEDDEEDDDDHEDEGIHKPPRKEYHDLVDMTAMVDIVFFLLIFFLMTSLYTLKPAIEMPKTEQSGSSGAVSTSSDAERDEVVVRIDEKDVVYVDDVAMATAHDLKDKLNDIVLSGGPTTLKIIGSPDATHGTLVMVMDAGAEAHMQNVKLSIKSTEDF